MAERELREHLSGYRQFAERNKKKKIRAQLSPEKGTRGELLHTHHARLVGISNSEPELNYRIARGETSERSREATVRRIISDLKSLLHHFPPPVPPELILSCPSSAPSSSSSSTSSSCSSPVLGVRLCFWLGSGVIGSPKPVLIIDPPAWQLPAKPLSTSCVPAKRSFRRLCARDLPRSVSTEVRGAGRRLARKVFSLWRNSV